MFSEYKVKLLEPVACNVTLCIIIMTIVFMVNTYVSNQHSHRKAVVSEVMKDNYSHYPHMF